jgi:hypothetical protein
MTPSSDGDAVKISGISDLPPFASAAALDHADQVNEVLMFTEPGRDFSELQIVIAYHDCLGVC